jgi:hypothetical protein
MMSRTDAFVKSEEAASKCDCCPKPDSNDPLRDVALLQEISSEHDSAIQVRNQAIEWSFGIVGGILLGSVVASQSPSLGAESLTIAWLGSALALVSVLPLLRLAAWHHAYLRRLDVVREHLLRYQLPKPPNTVGPSEAHVTDVVWQVHIAGRGVQSWKSIIRDTAGLGLGYLAVAAGGTFALLTRSELLDPPKTDWICGVAAVVIVAATVVGITCFELIRVIQPNRVRPETPLAWRFGTPAVFAPSEPCDTCREQDLRFRRG